MKKKMLLKIFLILGLGLLPFPSRAGLTSSSSLLMMDTTCAEGLSLGNCSSMQFGKINFIQQNPGIIGSLKEFNGNISYIPWLFDTGYIVGNAGYRLYDIPLGLSIASFNSREFDFISKEGAVLPEKLNINESLFLLGSAVKLKNDKKTELYLGFSVKYLLMKIYNYSGSGIAFDTGVNGTTQILNPKNHLLFGLAIQNLSPGIRFLDEVNRLPFRIRSGAGWQTEILSKEHLLTPMLEYIYDDEHKIDLGLEYGYADIIFFRLGYMLLSENDSFSDLSAGLGIQYKKIRFDYAIKILNDEDLDDNMLYAFSIGYSF